MTALTTLSNTSGHTGTKNKLVSSAKKKVKPQGLTFGNLFKDRKILLENLMKWYRLIEPFLQEK